MQHLAAGAPFIWASTRQIANFSKDSTLPDPLVNSHLVSLPVESLTECETAISWGTDQSPITHPHSTHTTRASILLPLKRVSVPPPYTEIEHHNLHSSFVYFLSHLTNSTRKYCRAAWVLRAHSRGQEAWNSTHTICMRQQSQQEVRWALDASGLPAPVWTATSTILGFYFSTYFFYQTIELKQKEMWLDKTLCHDEHTMPSHTIHT